MSLIQETPRQPVDSLLARVGSIPVRRRLRALLFPIAIIAILIAAMMKLGAMNHLDLGSAFVALVLTFTLSLWAWLALERSDMRAVAALAACREMHTLGALLETLNYSSRRVRRTVQSVLLDLLPRLTEDEAALLKTKQREILNALLYGDSGELAMAAMTAMAQVGDGMALPYLTSIASGKGVSGALCNRQAEVQERAQHAVQRIGERIEKQNRANVLLRGAQVPATPSEQLVRPAQGHPLRDGRELLRPQAGLKPDSDHKEKRL